MPGLPRIVLLVALTIPMGAVPAGEAPFDPADLLTPPAAEPKAGEAEAATTTAKQPVPAADALKTATSAIKELYRSDYATAKGRSALVSTLIDQALQTNDDPAMRYALLTEARELAIVAKNVAALLEVCERIAEGYAGDSVADLKRAALGRVSGVTVTSQLIKLLDAPDDAFANTAVGRWYANDIGQWEHALPLLAKGSDQSLAKVAGAELALTGASKPTDQTAVAEQWYELGKRTAPLKESFWRHALGLYETAKPKLSGLTLTIIEKRIGEIEDFLPLGPDIDYRSLSAGQWEKLKGKLITVDAGKGINATSVTLTEGQKIRVVPHPTDTWKVDDRGTVLNATWKGGMAGRRAVGSLQCRVGDGIEQAPGVISGAGQLSLFALAPRRMVVSGTIRVKILPVSE